MVVEEMVGRRWGWLWCVYMFLSRRRFEFSKKTCRVAGYLRGGGGDDRKTSLERRELG